MRSRTTPVETPAVLLDTARLLWPTARQIVVTRSPNAARQSRDYAVLPSLGNPRWLLPTDRPMTAAALLGTGSGPLRHTAERILALAHRTRLTARLPVRRLRVVGGETGSLLESISALSGPGADVAIRLGSWAHARSLVVRVFGPDGATRAFGKVGIDAAGRTSVLDEARHLARVSELGLREVRLAEVLHHGEWRGLQVLLVSPLLPSGPRVGETGPPVTAMLELARSVGPRSATLASSRWRRSVDERMAGVRDAGQRVQLEEAAAALDGATGLVLPLGPWHGDWTAWNMVRDCDQVLLWDWEHFAEDVPVGFDLVHYQAQELRVSTGTDRAAEQTWRRSAAQALHHHVGLGTREQEVVLVAYLLEVNLRYVLDRQGTPQSGLSRSGWGLDLLQHEVTALRRRA